jgi:hypothetical protein
MKSDYFGYYSSYQSAQLSYAANPTPSNLVQLVGNGQGMDEAAYSIVLHQLYDTANFHIDTLRGWLDRMHSVTAEFWLSNSYLASGDSTSALQVLGGLATEYNLSSVEQTDIGNYSTLTSLLSGQNAYLLDSATLANVKSLEHAGGFAEGWAQNILTLYGGHYPPNYQFSPGIRSRSNESYEYQSGKVTDQQFVTTVFPNPSTGVFNFRFNPKDGLGASLIRILDANGNRVLSRSLPEDCSAFTWEASNLAEGIYFYQILSGDNGFLATGRLVLTK